MVSIGIVGTGVAGLHLGLFLRMHDISTTIYTNRSAEQVATGGLLNTVMHHYSTYDRDMCLGVARWPLAEVGWWTRYHSVRGGGGPELSYRGNFVQPSVAIDYRLYLPQLEADFQDRGGRIEIRQVDEAALVELGARHDLVVVASGRGPLAQMFGRCTELSPYDRPQRMLLAGIFDGVRRPTPDGVTISVSRGAGELIDFPMFTKHGRMTALLFENVPGSPLEILSTARTSPEDLSRIVLAALERHFPDVYARVEESRFGLTGARDVLQGAVTPVVRGDFVELPGGTCALALGDVHAVVDPLMGQGANAASHSAFVVGAAVVDDLGFDRSFCRRVATKRWEMVAAATTVTNTMLDFPDHLGVLQAACARDQDVADAVDRAYADPVEYWKIVESPRRVEAFLAPFRVPDLPRPALAVAGSE